MLHKDYRLGTQTVLTIIFGECLTNTRGFFHNQYFDFPKGILYIGIILYDICMLI